jgi:hypothetical protein
MAVDDSIAKVTRREVRSGGLSDELMRRTLPASSISLP